MSESNEVITPQILKEMEEVVRSEGYEVNPPAYNRLHGWTFIIFQLACARTSLNLLVTHQSESQSMEDLTIRLSFLSNFIINYGKCFASAGTGRITLNPKDVFTNEPGLKLIHERIMSLRHKFVAHNDFSGLVVSTIAVKESGDQILVKHITTLGTPVGEVHDFAKALVHLESYVDRKLNQQVDYIKKVRGKPVIREG